MIDALLLTATLACASCGSGGDDPLILYPNESAKLYLGLAHASGYRNIGAAGDYTAPTGAKAKDTLTLALGKSVTRRAFVTAVFPYGRNERDGETRDALGDPSLGGRYTLVMPSIAEPALPQVQVLAGYKSATARSIRDTDTPDTLLDVFGSGFPEWRAGIDFWYGLSSIQGGAALVVVLPEARSFDGIEYQPGSIRRATATLGYAWTAMLRTSGGVNREERDAFVIDGELQTRGDQVNHSAFLNQDLKLSVDDTLRFGYSRQAAFGGNRNTARAVTVGMAYMRAF